MSYAPIDQYPEGQTPAEIGSSDADVYDYYNEVEPDNDIVFDDDDIMECDICGSQFDLAVHDIEIMVEHLQEHGIAVKNPFGNEVLQLMRSKWEDTLGVTEPTDDAIRELESVATNYDQAMLLDNDIISRVEKAIEFDEDLEQVFGVSSGGVNVDDWGKLYEGYDNGYYWKFDCDICRADPYWENPSTGDGRGSQHALDHITFDHNVEAGDTKRDIIGGDEVLQDIARVLGIESYAREDEGDCEKCKGTGLASQDDDIDCSYCDGTGMKPNPTEYSGVNKIDEYYAREYNERDEEGQKQFEEDFANYKYQAEDPEGINMDIVMEFGDPDEWDNNYPVYYQKKEGMNEDDIRNYVTPQSNYESYAKEDMIDEARVWWDSLPEEDRRMKSAGMMAYDPATLDQEYPDADAGFFEKEPSMDYDTLDQMAQQEINSLYRINFIEASFPDAWNDFHDPFYDDQPDPLQYSDKAWGTGWLPDETYPKGSGKENYATEDMEAEAGTWWDSLSVSDRDNLIQHQSDSWDSDKQLSWSELQTSPSKPTSDQPFFDSTTTVGDILTTFAGNFYKAQGLDDEQNAEAGGDWDGNHRPDWSDTGGSSNTWYGSVLDDTLSTRSGNTLNYGEGTDPFPYEEEDMPETIRNELKDKESAQVEPDPHWNAGRWTSGKGSLEDMYAEEEEDLALQLDSTKLDNRSRFEESK